jgi:hypothetical protein
MKYNLLLAFLLILRFNALELNLKNQDLFVKKYLLMF